MTPHSLGPGMEDQDWAGESLTMRGMVRSRGESMEPSEEM